MVQCKCGAKFYSRDDHYDHVCPLDPREINKKLQAEIEDLQKKLEIAESRVKYWMERGGFV